MTILRATLPVGLGDLIYAKALLEPVKHRFERINLTFNQHLLSTHDANYPAFIDGLSKILFTGHPYRLIARNYPHIGATQIASIYGLTPQKPDLGHLLCKGMPLNIGSEYIVLTTKIRWLKRHQYHEVRDRFFDLINRLGVKYKVVLLGEKVVERNEEYQHWGEDEIYGVYQDIVDRVHPDKLLDMTIPALGITSSDLTQFQQDCLIMQGAKIVITLGIGGNFSMATAVANTVGYRRDGDELADIIYAREYPTAKITKDWNRFRQILESYL
jgi:hypothetical protein